MSRWFSRVLILLLSVISFSVSADKINDKNGLPTVNIDFTTGVLPGSVTFTRASSGTYFDGTGTLQTAVTNAPRFDNNPVMLTPLGLLIELQSTNGIRNNMAVGLVAGSPGTYPNNITFGGNLLTSGVTQTIIGSTVENGITCWDIQFSGTLTVNNPFLNIFFEGLTQVAAAQGQTWTGSNYVRLIGGSLTNLSLTTGIFGRTSGGLSNESFATSITPTGSNLASQRSSVVGTFVSVSTAFVTSGIGIVAGTTGQVINVTLRIGMPQLEQQPSATSVIATSGSAVTRARDVASISPTTISSTNGTLQINGQTSILVGSADIGGIGTDTNNIYADRVFFVNATTVKGQLVDIVGGTVFSGINSATTATNGSALKTIISYNPVSQAIVWNGSSSGVGIGAIAAQPPMSTIFIGSGRVLAPSNWISKVVYWPRKLSVIEMARATQ